jgi:replicative DNA helicase
MTVTSSNGQHEAAAFGRTPPHDLAAEQCAVGGMLMSKDAIADVGQYIRPADHYRPAHQMIHEAILELDAAGEPTDAVAVAAHLLKHGLIGKIGGAGYLHDCIASVPTAANAGYHARIVREHAILRRLIERCTRGVQMAYEAAGDADEIAARVLAEVEGAVAPMSADTLPPFDEILQQTIGALESKARRGISLPWLDLDALLLGLAPGQLVLIGARPGIGKALALDTPLPTPTGWTTMGAVKAGDYVFGQDGRAARVTAVTDVMYGRPCFEIEFGDGTVIVADAEHRWLTETRAARRSEQQARTGYNRYKNQRTFPAVRTTVEIATTLRIETAERRLNHAVANCRPLDMAARDLPVAPYTLGAWLGDGRSNGTVICSTDPDILDEIRKDGYEIRQVGDLDYRFTSEPERQERLWAAAELVRQGIPVRTAAHHEGIPVNALAELTGPRRSNQIYNGKPPGEPKPRYLRLPERLRKLGVLGNKHIPAIYLRASEGQRRALLAGLLDTDGYCNKAGTVQFAVTSQQLAVGTRELISSLGYTSTLTTKRVPGKSEASSTCYIITFTPPDKVFRLPRKAVRQTYGPRGRHSKRMIVDIRPVPSVPVRCIAVDNADHLYLAGETCVPTHNSVVAADVAVHTATEGKPVLFMSAEMSREEVATRILAAQSQVNLHTLLARNLTEANWERVDGAYHRICGSPLWLDDEPGPSAAHIQARLREMDRTAPAELLVVDYLQLMSAAHAESRQVAVADLGWSLKQIARKRGIPVVVACQLNRNPESRSDKRPQKADLRESGALEQHADVIILLHREDAYDKESVRAGEIDFIVDKNRQGPTAVVTAAFQGHFSRVMDMARG